MVSAEIAATGMTYDSAPDSGYSVDNLTPAAPALLTGEYSAGGKTLHWARNTEVDLAGYRLYRGTTPGFAIGAGSFVAALPDTGYTDPGPEPFYYKLTAVDIHDNESPVAFLQPQGVLGVAGDGRAGFFHLPPGPHPMRGG